LLNITGTTPPSTLHTSGWKIPKDIELADEYFNQQGAVNLLIDANLFYEILRSGRQTCPGNYLVLQETVLGWTLSGRTPAVTTSTDTKRTFQAREDNSLELNLNRFRQVEAVEQVCEEHFLTHTTPQPD
jgi:hypothetical protein